MRELRVIGLDDDGRFVVCEDVEHEQTFRVPADEHLWAAARGDLTRLGQIEIAIEAQLRPREIQARIRAGATIEQVAAAAGLSEQKVERYAHPVLLERSRAAEIAQGAHPVLADGPAVGTLLHTVANAFTLRGQDLTGAQWDAWRGEDGRWVVQLLWRTGRSDNRAHWRFQPGAHGGTAVALDDAAAELLDPSTTRPLRPISSEPVARNLTAAPVSAVPEEPVLVDEPVLDEAEPDDETPVAAAEERPSAKSPRNRPSMPSWEDVLLGVRSQRG